MARHETVNLETVIGLAEKLSAVEKLKLVERIVVDLEPIVRAREPEKQKPLRRKGKPQPLTEEQIKEVKRKLWGEDERAWSTQIVRLKYCNGLCSRYDGTRVAFGEKAEAWQASTGGYWKKQIRGIIRLPSRGPP